MNIRKVLLLPPAFLLVVLQASAARPPLSGFLAGGWDGNADRGYSYVSGGTSFPISERQSLFIEVTGSHLYYDYPDGEGLTKVNSPGIGTMAGARWSSGFGTFSIGAGYQIRSNRVKRPDGAREREQEEGVIAAASWFFQPAPSWGTFVLTSYEHVNSYFWGRIGAKRLLSLQPDHFVEAGFDVTAEGNPDSRAFQAGPLLQLRPGGGSTSLQFRLGASYLDDSARRDQWEPYFGVSFWRPF